MTDQAQLIFFYLLTSSSRDLKLLFQVCHNWRNFIDHNFFNLPKGQKWIKNKLASNILDENYEPQTKQITTSSEDNFKFFAVVADEESVCVSTFCGSIFSYKFLTLEHMWTLKLGKVTYYSTVICYTYIFFSISNYFFKKYI